MYKMDSNMHDIVHTDWKVALWLSGLQIHTIYDEYFQKFSNLHHYTWGKYPI